MRNYKDEYDEYERSPRRKRYIQCSDRMCGAEDCPNCRPGNFRGGVYVGDLQPYEPEEVSAEPSNESKLSHGGGES
jgi:hypothetical protein